MKSIFPSLFISSIWMFLEKGIFSNVDLYFLDASLYASSAILNSEKIAVSQFL